MKFLQLFSFILLTSATQGQVDTTPFLELTAGIEVSDTINELQAIDSRGKLFSWQANELNEKIVIVFIRGKWCGYCNKHLSHLQDSLSQITAKGASVVIVSPEKPEFIKETIEKTKIEATILYDSGYVIMKQFDVLWAPKEKDLKKYSKYFGDTMKKSHSDDTQRLPVPATYILDENGLVLWRHFDRDYSNRSTVKNILENL